MDSRNDEGTRLTLLSIPQDGLEVVLSSWTGRGSVFEALSVAENNREARQWSPGDIRLRANRVLLARLETALMRWPTRTAQWLDHLPASKTHTLTVEKTPFAGVSWTDTRRQFGWPPSAFAGKQAERGADMLVVQVLRWCLDRLRKIWLDVGKIFPDLVFKPIVQMQAALALLEHEPIAGAAPASPARTDLKALRREGSPWGSVADVAHELLEAEESIGHLVYQLLIPDEHIRWRLFHLAILGLVLKALKQHGCGVTSLRPLSPRSVGPNYVIKAPGGRTFLLWFEASNVWDFLRRPSPFIEATEGMKQANRSNGADILVLEVDKSALIIECKYSTNQDWAARNGYYQAVAYATEARSRLAAEVTSLVVVPESVAPTVSLTKLISGVVGTIPPSALNTLVGALVKPTLATTSQVSHL